MIRISIQRTRRAETSPTEGNRARRKLGAVVKLGLGGMALVGIGAAATSAAWTDDAWFSTSATAASVSLFAFDPMTTGCMTPTAAPSVALLNSCWEDAGPSKRIAVPSTAFSGLIPGTSASSKDYTVYVYNNGSSNLVVSGTAAATPPVAGTIFDAPDPAVVSLGGLVDLSGGATVGTSASPLLPGHAASVKVTVAAGTNWANEQSTYAGKTGALTVTFVGAAAA